MFNKLKTVLRAKYRQKDYGFLHPRDVDEWNLYKLYDVFKGSWDPISDFSPDLGKKFPLLDKFLPSFDPDDVEKLFREMRADASTMAVVSPHLQKASDEYLRPEPVPEWLEGRNQKIIWLIL